MKKTTKPSEWIPDEETQWAFRHARNHIEPWLRNLYRRKWLSKQIATRRQNALVRGERILLKMNEAGIGEEEMLELLDAVVRDRMEQKSLINKIVQT